jgi:hypothetical protein
MLAEPMAYGYTSPVAVTVATLVLLLLHVPPGKWSVKVTEVANGQKKWLAVGLIIVVPGYTVTFWVTPTRPQLFMYQYVTVTVADPGPGIATTVSTPAGVILEMPGLLVLKLS